MTDNVMRELWQIKDRIASDHDYDVDALVAHLRTRTRPADQVIVDLSAQAVSGERTSSSRRESSA